MQSNEVACLDKAGTIWLFFFSVVAHTGNNFCIVTWKNHIHEQPKLEHINVGHTNIYSVWDSNPQTQSVIPNWY